MKKVLCVLLIVIMALSLCSCGQKSFEDALEAVKNENYYVEEMSLSDFWGKTDLEAKVFIAFDKTDIDEDYYSDWDGDVVGLTKNFVWVIYFESKQDANSFYPQMEELRKDYDELFEEFAQDKEEAAADGIVFKEFLCEIDDNVIYFGTEDAIALVK